MTAPRVRIVVANGTRYAFIQHARGDLSILVPDGVSPVEALADRAKEWRGEAEARIRRAQLAEAAAAVLDEVRP